MTKKLTFLIVGISALAIILASCNHSDSTLVSFSDEPSEVTTGITTPAYGDLPSVTVVRPVAETRLNLTDLVDKSRPTLIWFWAPHCPQCIAEIPKIEELATRNLDNFKVIALGSGDDLVTAKNFEKLARFENVDLVWDKGEGFGFGESWKAFGVSRQTIWLLLDVNGNTIINPRDGSPENGESEILRKIIEAQEEA